MYLSRYGQVVAAAYRLPPVLWQRGSGPSSDSAPMMNQGAGLDSEMVSRDLFVVFGPKIATIRPLHTITAASIT